MKFAYLKFILALLTFSVCLNAFETYEGKTVGDIQVNIQNADSNDGYDTRTIVSRLKTRKGDPFSQLSFDSDLKMLSEEYDRIEPYVSMSGNQIFIKINLWTRPTIRSIQWNGNKRISTKKLQKELNIKPYTTFNRSEFNRQFNKVKELYIKKGFFESQLSYAVEPIKNTNQIDILIDIFEGRSGTIREIYFEGFSKLEEKEIREEIYTKKYYLLFSWLTGSGTYKEEVLEQDKMGILNYSCKTLQHA